MCDRLTNLIKAGTPLVWLQTGEELRAEHAVMKACDDLDREMFLWRVTTGTVRRDPSDATCSAPHARPGRTVAVAGPT